MGDNFGPRALDPIVLTSARDRMTQSPGAQQLERIARLIVIAVTLWMLGVGCWEIAAPFGAGHAAVLPARGIIADNMVQYHIGFPVRSYAAIKPTSAAAYAHHPFGTYYLFAAMRWLFGRHEWTIRLVPVLVSASMPALLYGVSRRVYGALAGAMAALGWGVLPIALGFAQFPSFEMFSLAAMLLVIIAALRFEARASWWRLLLLLLAIALALQTDWIAYLFVALVGAAAACAVAFTPHREQRGVPTRRLLQALVLGGAIFGATLLIYVVSFRQAGLLKDWLDSAQVRAHGNDLPLLEILRHRRYWIEVMFTKPAILVGLVGAFSMLVRLVLRRRYSELYPLLLLLVAAVHYVHFKAGADVHIYWSLPFAAQFCFGLALVFCGAESAFRRFLERRKARLSETGASYVALGVTAGLALLVLPDGLRALDYSRDSGCRLNDDGHLNLQDLDKNLALQFFKQKVPERFPVTLQASMNPNWSQDWAIERPTALLSALGLSMLASPRYTLLDMRFAAPTTASWAIQSSTTVIGPYWLVDTESMPGELRVYGFQERNPSWLERYFVQAHDPIRRVVDDPLRTWEYRQHLALKPNPVPMGLEAKDQARLLHNVRIAEGNLQGASELRAAIEATLDKRSARSYVGGLQLLGHRLIEGIVPRLEVYFLAARSVGPDAFFDVRSIVDAAPKFSFVVTDDKVKRYGVGFEIHPSLWQSGMIYVSSVEVRRRPGHERFFAAWTGSQRPLPSEGVEEIPLFERP